MNSLFKDYAKEVLGLEAKTLKMPKIPNPFSPFLEKGSENMIEALEMKNKQILHMIKILESENEKINKKLVKLKKQKNKTKLSDSERDLTEKGN
ncbi:hypothetical protein AC477_05990 [miscellaneous Crenarchaeota group-1 archaeon SG8-32-1]|uniref:Uncharacterized protein n=1 Tax=miscellaneous Crenarchaeota group-1 archaeon SG8-32-1 TaxID=1685124 RepID=A0A0M0BLY0_9ARCH|nr:MAG: hypothetical protein AC477_05990 [miscellaneous Crenarchaeota group-1 archaeon SG8-32-1]